MLLWDVLLCGKQATLKTLKPFFRDDVSLKPLQTWGAWGPVTAGLVKDGSAHSPYFSPPPRREKEPSLPQDLECLVSCRGSKFGHHVTDSLIINQRPLCNRERTNP